MIAAVLALATLLGPYVHPAVPERAPRHVTTHARPGVASWFDARTGTAAAGPALRRALGSHWRGSAVIVTANGHSVRVVLDDWCACRGRLLDLSRGSFAQLADPSRGLVRVSIAP